MSAKRGASAFQFASSLPPAMQDSQDYDLLFIPKCRLSNVSADERVSSGGLPH